VSLSRFHKETGDFLSNYESLPLDQKIYSAQEAVRNRWIASGELHAIVTATLGNWTSGNCVEFMVPISEALLAAKQPDLHRHLWTRTVKRQIADLFRDYGFIRHQKLTADQILSTDTSTFDERDVNCYSNHIAATAFFLKRVLSTLDMWQRDVQRASGNVSEIDEIRRSVLALKKPTFEVNRLPPNNSFKPKPLRGSA